MPFRAAVPQSPCVGTGRRVRKPSRAEAQGTLPCTTLLQRAAFFGELPLESLQLEAGSPHRTAALNSLFCTGRKIKPPHLHSKHCTGTDVLLHSHLQKTYIHLEVGMRILCGLNLACQEGSGSCFTCETQRYLSQVRTCFVSTETNIHKRKKMFKLLVLFYQLSKGCRLFWNRAAYQE